MIKITILDSDYGYQDRDKIKEWLLATFGPSRPSKKSKKIWHLSTSNWRHEVFVRTPDMATLTALRWS